MRAMTTAITGISSMATRLVLAELAEAWQRRGGAPVAFESVGGVDAARRVADGEPFDLVVLAADAIEKLMAGGHLRAGSRVDLVHSGVAVAVRAGAPRPDIGSVAALQVALGGARRIGYSTGPSGTQLLRLFEAWGLTAALHGRLMQAPAGVPVGQLVARGEVDLGFQQLSELLHVEGIDLLGPMPDGARIDTTFAGAVGTRARQPQAAAAVLAWLAGPEGAAAKRRHGMEPA